METVEIENQELLDEYRKVIDDMMNAMDSEQLKFVQKPIAKFEFTKSKDSYGFIEWLSKDVLTNPDKLFHLLFDNDENIGYLYLEYDKVSKVLSISNLYIKPEYRRKGFAEKVLTDIIADSKKLKTIVAIRLSVFTLNPALKLYEKLGFKDYSKQMYLLT